MMAVRLGTDRWFMMMYKLSEGEQAFRDWLETTEFIDESGNIVTPKLAPDESDDPDGDRTGA
jgi:hypothetical protein